VIFEPFFKRGNDGISCMIRVDNPSKVSIMNEHELQVFRLKMSGNRFKLLDSMEALKKQGSEDFRKNDLDQALNQ